MGTIIVCHLFNICKEEIVLFILMRKMFAKIILGLFLIAGCSMIAQTKKTKVISFDLDKREIGDMPFDERFKLSGFDTKYDEIKLQYTLDPNYLEKPRYNDGGSLDFEIDKITGKANYYGTLGPLHPNVPYDFTFTVSKEITLNDTEEEGLRNEIYSLINNYIKNPAAGTASEIKNFKTSLQGLLEKYAKSDKIKQADGSPLDFNTSPLFSSQLSTVLANMIVDYNTIQRLYSGGNDARTRASDNASTELTTNANGSLFFSNLDIALNDDNRLSESFVALLEAPIDPVPGVNEKLTLRQYLNFINEDPKVLLGEIIQGNRKIEGDAHKVSNGIDIPSIELLKKVFEKLNRKSVKKSSGSGFFSINEKSFLTAMIGKLNTIISVFDAYNTVQSNIAKNKESIPNLLRNAILVKEIKISESVNIDVLAEKNPYIGLDAGLVYAFGSANGLFAYQGANFYRRPVNHQTPFSDLEGWDEFYKRFSLYLGIAEILTEKEDRFEALIGNTSLLFGAGYRVVNGFRINVGGLLHYVKDANPVVDNKEIKVSPTVSVSIDINLVKALGAVGGLLNID